MHKLNNFAVAAIAAVFLGAFSGCAMFEKCGPADCSTDIQIKKDVNDLLDQHREFGPPGTVHVQVINGLVYISGQVNSDFEVRNAEALVRQVANVKDVENNLAPRSNAR